MIYSYQRGHKIIFKNNKWVYADTLKSINKERPCKKCNQMPTIEGYDACIGYIEGVKHACCGHGVEEKYINEL